MGFEAGAASGSSGMYRTYPGHKFTNEASYNPKCVVAGSRHALVLPSPLLRCVCVRACVRVCACSRVRPWYVQAVGSPSRVNTEPYLDAFGLGWMITTAQRVRHLLCCVLLRHVALMWTAPLRHGLWW